MLFYYNIASHIKLPKKVKTEVNADILYYPVVSEPVGGNRAGVIRCPWSFHRTHPYWKICKKLPAVVKQWKNIGILLFDVRRSYTGLS